MPRADVVILGAAGQLGRDLMRSFASRQPLGLDHAALDIRDQQALESALRTAAPSLVINATGFHNVERCEREPREAFATNALAVDSLALVCAGLGATLVTISTDYVFDGKKHAPYVESDAANPLNAYGVSKYAGELLARRHELRLYVVRTSGLYGIAGSSSKGYTFVERILERAREPEPPTVVADMISSPSYTGHVAAAIAQLVERGEPGTYHVTNAGSCSWFEFASAALQLVGSDTVPKPVAYRDYAESRVRRPLYSALASERLGKLAIRVPPWREGLAAYMTERAGLD